MPTHKVAKPYSNQFSTVKPHWVCDCLEGKILGYEYASCKECGKHAPWNLSGNKIGRNRVDKALILSMRYESWMTTEKIGSILNISARTVRNHIESVTSPRQRSYLNMLNKVFVPNKYK